MKINKLVGSMGAPTVGKTILFRTGWKSLGACDAKTDWMGNCGAIGTVLYERGNIDDVP